MDRLAKLGGGAIWILKFATAHDELGSRKPSATLWSIVMKKYEPLGEYLATIPASQAIVTLTFNEIEKIIGAELPPSAAKHRAWWANQETGSRAPHWQAAGFKVDKVDQQHKIVSFRRDGPLLEDPTITDITNAIEEQAPGYAFGELQAIRERLKDKQWRSNTIFKARTIHENYAFHYGGRTELQFNIGFEWEENGEMVLRHGVAISLKRGASINQIDDAILTRIARLNEYLESHTNDFTDFFMYNSWYDSDDWSGYHTLRPVPPEIVELDAFIFIGKQQSASEVNIALILRDFDRLLPMYMFVEGSGDPSTGAAETPADFQPGLTRKPSSSTVSMAERRLNKALRHNDIQYALGQYLIRQYGDDTVRDEYRSGNRTRVDLAVKQGDEFTYYEIKIGETARHCIRQAIGQLLEYSYWPQARRASRLIVVGEPILDSDAAKYLTDLRSEFDLPIHYQQFDMKKQRLLES